LEHWECWVCYVVAGSDFGSVLRQYGFSKRRAQARLFFDINVGWAILCLQKFELPAVGLELMEDWTCNPGK